MGSTGRYVAKYRDIRDTTFIGTPSENQQAVRTEASRDIANPNTLGIIIVDSHTKLVEVIAGTIEPFRKGLDHNHPGWQEGKIAQE